MRLVCLIRNQSRPGSFAASALEAETVEIPQGFLEKRPTWPLSGC